MMWAWPIWIAFITLDAWFNYWEIDHKKNIFHPREAFYRVIAFGLLYVVDKVYQLNLLQNISFALGCFFSGWLAFNIELNWFRKLPIGYLGNAPLDRLEALCPSRLATIFWKAILSAGAISAFCYGTLNPAG